MTFEQERLLDEYRKIENANMKKVQCVHEFNHIYTTVSGTEQVFQCTCGAGMVYNITTKKFY